MAIVRTTPKETGNSAPGGKPNNSPTSSAKSVVPATSSTRVPARPAVQRGSVQTAPKPSRAFFTETVAELKKVVWPSWDEVRSGTIVTILLLIVFGAYIFGLDAFFAWFFNTLGLYS